MAGNDMEHAALIDLIGKAMGAKGADQVDVMRTYSGHITRLRDEAIGEELDAQSRFLWEHGTMLEKTFEVLNANGDETAAAIIDGQVRLLREMSGRLSRRAAAIRGVTEEELKMRALLLVPNDATPGAAQPAFTQPAGEVAPMVFMRCQVCGFAETIQAPVEQHLERGTAWVAEHEPVCPGKPKEEKLPAE
jgi:hypothetical protein